MDYSVSDLKRMIRKYKSNEKNCPTYSHLKKDGLIKLAKKLKLIEDSRMKSKRQAREKKLKKEKAETRLRALRKERRKKWKKPEKKISVTKGRMPIPQTGVGILTQQSRFDDLPEFRTTLEPKRGVAVVQEPLLVELSQSLQPDMSGQLRKESFANVMKRGERLARSRMPLPFKLKGPKVEQSKLKKKRRRKPMTTRQRRERQNRRENVTKLDRTLHGHALDIVQQAPHPVTEEEADYFDFLNNIITGGISQFF